MVKQQILTQYLYRTFFVTVLGLCLLHVRSSDAHDSTDDKVKLTRHHHPKEVDEEGNKGGHKGDGKTFYWESSFKDEDFADPCKAGEG